MHGLQWGMLTRSGVAKRLGKSIATVRRMEDEELHPLRDARGVLQFSEEEVERIARSRSTSVPCRHGIAVPRAVWSDDYETRWMSRHANLRSCAL